MFKTRLLLSICIAVALTAKAGGMVEVTETSANGSFAMCTNGRAATIFTDGDDYKVVGIAAGMLADDVERVTGTRSELLTGKVLPKKGVPLLVAGDSCGTRGIGVYPGSPDECFAPSIEWIENGEGLANVALHRAAYASSAFDYNHTAHLVTDGICDDSQPATLTVSTPEGRLPRREAEWSIDGGKFSRNILMGSDTWLRYDWSSGGLGDWSSVGLGKRSSCGLVKKVRLQGMVAYDDNSAGGYSFRCQTSDDGAQWHNVGIVEGNALPGELLHYKLHSDPNKQEEQDYLPARVLTEEINLDEPVSLKHFRLMLSMKGAAHWDVREVTFLDANGNEIEAMSSRHFSSMWISDGGGEQWLYADLGRSMPVSELRILWHEMPRRGDVEVSDDAVAWRKVAEIGEEKGDKTGQYATAVLNAHGRYVRLLLHEPGMAGRYSLREMQVLSPVHILYRPHSEAPATNGRRELSGGKWTLQRSSEVSAAGETIAREGFDDEAWIPATVPGTVLASYINIGAVPNPNYADNIEQISESFFRSNFWYRNEFEAGEIADGQQQWLNFDGINWKANVFLNGQRLGTIDGAFMRGKFNVTGILRRGTNYLAVEILCNDHFAAVKEKNENTTQFNGGILGADNPTFHATVGWDWITTVRGREAGIWNEVYLTTTGMVSVEDPYVETVVDKSSDNVSVTPSVFLRNNDNKAVTGVLSGHIGDVRFQQSVTLPAHAEQEVRFLPEQFPQLRSSDFRLWWPNGYGEPYLYDAGFAFTPDGGVPTSKDYKVGLRQMEYVGLTDSLRIFINGRRFIPLGGNWGFDEHNLLYRSREYDIAVNYHREMNFTMIRNWVGQIGDESFYEACDRHGIMVWQDFWLANPADGPDPYDNVMFLNNAEDYLRRIRQHPSIGIYCGRNEGFPPESLDRKLREYVHTLAPGMEYISHSSSQGVSGGGPYRALAMKEYFEKQSGKIHSERGMPNVMNIESMRRTMSPDGLWPQSLQWGQHDYTLQGAQRASEFNRLMTEGFGDAMSAEDFTRWAQLINYNGYRAMFESTSKSRAGLLLWMSHPCWPSMVWQTYDYYFEPTGAYFGAKKACEPLHIQYNALTDSVEIVNHSAGSKQGLTAIATVFDINGKRVAQQKSRIDSNDDSTTSWITLSRLLPTAPSDVYFVRLQLADKKGVVSENLYIRGRKENNYQALLRQEKADVEMSVKPVGSSGGVEGLAVTLHNKSRVPAVFLRLNLKGDDGEQILPVVYSDNYLTLMPGESRDVNVTWRKEDARGRKAHVEITQIQ